MLSDNQFLHPILPCEFLDSPEFESSRNTVDDKFKVGSFQLFTSAGNLIKSCSVSPFECERNLIRKVLLDKNDAEFFMFLLGFTQRTIYLRTSASSRRSFETVSFHYDNKVAFKF